MPLIQTHLSSKAFFHSQKVLCLDLKDHDSSSSSEDSDDTVTPLSIHAKSSSRSRSLDLDTKSARSLALGDRNGSQDEDMRYSVTSEVPSLVNGFVQHTPNRHSSAPATPSNKHLEETKPGSIYEGMSAKYHGSPVLYESKVIVQGDCHTENRQAVTLEKPKDAGQTCSHSRQDSFTSKVIDQSTSNLNGTLSPEHQRRPENVSSKNLMTDLIQKECNTEPKTHESIIMPEPVHDTPENQLHVTTDINLLHGEPTKQQVDLDTKASGYNGTQSFIQDTQETMRSVERPPFPVRVSSGEPTPFSIEEQNKVMRWRQWPIGFGQFRSWQVEWIVEPDINAILQTIESSIRELDSYACDIKISSLTDDPNFNKVYVVRTIVKDSIQEYILRLAAPVDPYYKVESEVATMEYARHFTSIPVPKVFYFDSSTNNAVGFEWILMEKASGSPLSENFLDLDNEKHKDIANQLAYWSYELGQLRSTKIGSLYLRWTPSHMEFFVSRLVHFRGTGFRELLKDIPRGPFQSLTDYYESVLKLNILMSQDHETHKVLLSDEEEDRLRYQHGDMPTQEEADNQDIYQKICFFTTQRHEELINFYEYLFSVLPKFTEQIWLDECPNMLIHPDLALRNIFSDEHGNITAIIDWERSSILPAVQLDLYPDMLQSQEQKDNYNETVCRRHIADDGTVEVDPNDCMLNKSQWRMTFERALDIICTSMAKIYKERIRSLGDPRAELFEYEGNKDLLDFRLDDMITNVRCDLKSAKEWITILLDTGFQGYDETGVSQPEADDV